MTAEADCGTVEYTHTPKLGYYDPGNKGVYSGTTLIFNDIDTYPGGDTYITIGVRTTANPADAYSFDVHIKVVDCSLINFTWYDPGTCSTNNLAPLLMSFNTFSLSYQWADFVYTSNPSTCFVE